MKTVKRALMGRVVFDVQFIPNWGFLTNLAHEKIERSMLYITDNAMLIVSATLSKLVKS